MLSLFKTTYEMLHETNGFIFTVTMTLLRDTDRLGCNWRPPSFHHYLIMHLTR